MPSKISSPKSSQSTTTKKTSQTPLSSTRKKKLPKSKSVSKTNTSPTRRMSSQSAWYSIQAKKPVSYRKEGKNLVIVESPSKAKTISKYLWSDYEVKASMGHIVDLPNKSLGVDLQTFEPQYEISADKKKVVSELISLANKSKKVWLATDEDREGEAIARHLASVMWLDMSQTPRIVFHEITKPAITHAIDHPRTIDFNLVYSQQTRRILDRLVWYQISPILWKKLKPGLSAGRVQSVAVKLTVVREREISNFVPQEYWTIEAQLHYQKHTLKIWCQTKDQNNKPKRRTKKSKDDVDVPTDKAGKFTSTQVDEILTQLYHQIKTDTDTKTGHHLKSISQSIDFKIQDIVIKASKKSSPPPFITSTLQQVASRSLWRSVKQVMSTAQKLYENGYITYMRTDSTNLSNIALEHIKTYITSAYWSQYSQATQYASKSKNAQEAHEAIRPTDIQKTDTSLWSSESKLYQLIWKRTIASQMKDALYQNTIYHLHPVCAPNQGRSAEGKVMEFDWWLKIYGKDEDDQSQMLPSIAVDTLLSSKHIIASQDFTKPPARYTEASLVKALESNGIGRPSTYASVITTIQTRWYVVKQEGKLIPTEIAFKVVDHLSQYFKDLMDYDFTAQMEQKLDDIAVWDAQRNQILSHFNTSFQEELAEFNDGNRVDTTIDKICPKCGQPLKLKFSKSGGFVWCSGYPDCDYIEQTADKQSKLDEIKSKYEWLECPAWGKIVVKIGRFWPFLSSDQYPTIKRIKSPAQFEADKMMADRPIQLCEKCGTGHMVIKTSRKGPFLACDRYPECKNAKNLDR